MWKYFVAGTDAVDDDDDDDDDFVKSPSSASDSTRDIQSDDLSSVDDVSVNLRPIIKMDSLSLIQPM